MKTIATNAFAPFPAAAEELGCKTHQGFGAGENLALVTQDGFAEYQIEALAYDANPVEGFCWAEVAFTSSDPELGDFPEQCRLPVVAKAGVTSAAVLEALKALGLAPADAVLTSVFGAVETAALPTEF
jgi:hypothetical protein